MSTILKALKKLEEEKRAAAPMPLADKFLGAAVGKRGKSRAMSLVAAGAAGGLLLAVLMLAGYFWMKGETQNQPALSRSDPPQQPALTASVGASPPALTAPAAVATPALVAPAAARTPAATLPTTSAASQSMAATTPQTPRGVAPPAASPDGHAGSHLSGRSPAAGTIAPDQVVLADRQIPPTGQQWTAPHLIVTEIFAGAGEDVRMAVVNGLPVMEGTRVEDALVKEIRAGEVLFEIGGRSVVVLLRAGD